ncbi:MAG: GNAT family N-acetyltransferase [Lachnospiraceae bacterium]|nr:GNAT family N-acetyltransferase [Lachnospiraceae bacterium]
MSSTRNIYIKPLTLDEAKAVYIGNAHRDFPSDELKPFSMIERLWNRWCYFGYGFYEDDILRAYAFLLADDSTNMLLLDYFAVCENARGKGYGAEALALLKEHCMEWDGIIFEVEDDTCAESDEERQIRLRRISFYEKCGVVMTDVRSHVFGVDYRLMVMQLAAKDAGERIGEKLTSMYKIMLPKSDFDSVFRLK